MATPINLRGGLRQNRLVADREIAEPQIGEAAALQHRLRRKADNRVVAMPPGKFLEEMRRARAGDRHLDRDQQILRRQLRLVDAGEERLCGNPPLAAGAADHDGRAQRQHAGRQFGRRIGLRKAAADRAAVADRGVRDVRHRRPQQRRAFPM